MGGADEEPRFRATADDVEATVETGHGQAMAGRRQAGGALPPVANQALHRRDRAPRLLGASRPAGRE